MALTLQEQLTALAHGFSLSRLPSPAAANPRHVAVKLTPPASALDATGVFISTITEVLDPVTKRQIVPTAMNLNLSWRAKDVRFVDTDILNGSILGGMPVADALTPTLDLLTEGTALPTLTAPGNAGVPGLIGALTGTFQLPIETIDITKPAPLEHKVLIELRITITDSAGNRVPIGHSAVDPMMFTEVPGDELILPAVDATTALQQLHLVLAAAFVDQGNITVATVSRSIRASLRLHASGVLSDQIELPPLNVSIPSIPVPAVLVLCENVSFGGRRMVILPANSPVDPADTTNVTNLAGFLGPLVTALGTLVPAGATSPAPHPLIGFLGPMGTGSFVSALRPPTANPFPTVVFAKGDQIANLDDYPFQGGVPGFGRHSPEDMMRSLIFIGVRGRKVQLFNDRSFDSRQGQIDITLGPEMYTFVSTLNTATPVSDQTAADRTPNRVSVIERPGGYRGFLHNILTFGAELSSVRFGFGS